MKLFLSLLLFRLYCFLLSIVYCLLYETVIYCFRLSSSQFSQPIFPHPPRSPPRRFIVRGLLPWVFFPFMTFLCKPRELSTSFHFDRHRMFLFYSMDIPFNLRNDIESDFCRRTRTSTLELLLYTCS